MTQNVPELLHVETTIAYRIFHLAEAAGLMQPIAVSVSSIVYIYVYGYKDKDID